MQGGHSVPKEKIVSRYYRSLKLLSKAVKYSSRAYIFDNSSQEKLWIAQINDGKSFEFKSEKVPPWVYEYLLDAK
jgi:predicted ABC-type ATPase